MHNGQIGNFDRVRRRLEARLDDRFYAQRAGSTDSELLFLLMLQMAEETGDQADMVQAMGKAVATVISTCCEQGISPLVRLTAALSDGRTVYGFRYSSDRICPTLYLGNNGKAGVCLVSEPLDGESERWRAVPPGSVVEITSDSRIEVSDFVVPA